MRCDELDCICIIATPGQKAKISKYIAKNRMTNAICYYSRELPSLKESNCHVQVEEGFSICSS